MEDLKVMLIEDDQAIREDIVSSLRESGFDASITSPASLAEVEELFIKNSSQYTAVICDANLSNFQANGNKPFVADGLDFLNKLRMENRDLPMALYSTTSIVSFDVPDLESHSIEKKNNYEDILESIKGFLDIAADFKETEEEIEAISENSEENKNELGQHILKLDSDIKIVNACLLDKIAASPELINKITWRNFEVLIAELLDSLGYTITLGNGGPDGGKDIVAVKKDSFSELVVAVECKYYTQPRKVGRPTIQKLLGVVEANKYSAGVVATSSFFTSKAIDFAAPLQPKIVLHDYQSIESMIREYSKGKDENNL